MTIDEAIELLGGYVYEEKPCPVGLFDEATRLGIEALKAVSNYRLCGPLDLFKKLPGETEE
ncbi:hypothetical protein ES708_23180 [subsurface metagenome]